MKKLLSVVLLSLVLGAMVGCKQEETAPPAPPTEATPATNAAPATP